MPASPRHWGNDRNQVRPDSSSRRRNSLSTCLARVHNDHRNLRFRIPGKLAASTRNFSAAAGKASVGTCLKCPSQSFVWYRFIHSILRRIADAVGVISREARRICRGARKTRRNLPADVDRVRLLESVAGKWDGAMQFLPTELAGVVVIEPRVFEDERGFF